jgi:DNA-directed RNA polymerase subunit K/omega
MAQDAKLEMNIDKLEKERGISRYKACLMAAQEARYLNDQAKLGLIDLGGKKANTVALERLYAGKVVEVDGAAE